MLGITLFLAVLEELERGESESEVSHSVVSDFVTPWTVACQSLLSIGILQARKLEWVATVNQTQAACGRAGLQIQPCFFVKSCSSALG